ncbi:MAG TPA: hypothetical protein VJU86_04490 [Pyrinomonadaceae bacterium]|nr:hypothetical protein [Pyrinomonadaceae bacterium]
MSHTLFEETGAERKTLLSFAFACYSITVVAFAVLAYSIGDAAADSAGIQISVIYSQFGI